MLTGNTNEERIWNYLKAQGLTDCGAAGLMGNLYAESGLRPNNLQNAYIGKMGYADEEYTDLVDRGIYTNFANDRAGYGLCQWTYPIHKAALLAYVKAANKSIGDLETQLAFLLSELNSYGLLDELKKSTSIWDAFHLISLQLKSAGMNSEAIQAKWNGYGQTYYDKYAAKKSHPAAAPSYVASLQNA